MVHSLCILLMLCFRNIAVFYSSSSNTSCLCAVTALSIYYMLQYFGIICTSLLYSMCKYMCLFSRKRRFRKLCVITSQLPTRDLRRRISRWWIQSLNTGMCNYRKPAETVNFSYFLKLVELSVITEKHCPRTIVTFKGMLFRSY